MSRNFEQEYREMMNKQTPDLWDRIEAGVKASDRSNSVITGIDDLRKETEIKKEKKRFPNYYQVMAVAGVAACFAVLAVGAPAVKQSMHMEKEAEQGLTEAGLELPGDSSSAAVTSSAKSSSEKESSSAAAAQNDESSSVQAEASSSQVQTANEESSSKKSKKPEKEAAKDDSSATASQLNHDDEASSQPVQETADSTSVEASSDETASTSAAESTTKKKKKKTSSSDGHDVAVTSDADAQSGKPESDLETVAAKDDAASIAQADAKAQAEAEAKAQAEAEAKAQAEAEAEAQKAEEEKKEPVTYTGIVAKVSSMKESDGAIIYTFKIISDENGNFSKNKKIKVMSSESLEKGSSYVIAFSDDGTKKGSSTLYKLIAVSDFETE